MDTIDQLFKEVDDEIAVVVDNILKTATPELDASRSPEEIAQARTALIDFLSAKEVRNRAAKGLNIIFRELEHHATPVQLANIKAEWEKNTKALTEKIQEQSNVLDAFNADDTNNTNAASPETPPTEGNAAENPIAQAEQSLSFQDIFPISDTTVEHFYQCGYRLHQNGQYQEAADVFFVMSSMDYRRHNVWMALGLAEKALSHWDLALAAFSMAILTNMQEPLAFLHSAACYIALGKNIDAQECLQGAAELLQKVTDTTDQTKQIRDYMAALKELSFQ